MSNLPEIIIEENGVPNDELLREASQLASEIAMAREEKVRIYSQIHEHAQQLEEIKREILKLRKQAALLNADAVLSFDPSPNSNRTLSFTWITDHVLSFAAGRLDKNESIRLANWLMQTKGDTNETKN